MLHVGIRVLDKPTREPCEIRHVLRVPRRQDLFGRPVPGYRRFTVQFDDGRWANDRRAGELAPLEIEAPVAV